METTSDAAMTADEYRALRAELGMTQEKLAWTLRVSTSTIQKREQGAVPIDHEAAVAIRALTAEPKGAK
jgi:DNA-binding transcriptional regulator YiaG